MIEQVTVFAASSRRVPSRYLQAAEETARVLAANGVKVIYGGGSLGLMGSLADRMIREGGYIRGVIPRFMIDAEWAHLGLNELVVVETMHERKRAFLEATDAVIALPGGTGTLEELMESITLKRLGMLTCPIVLINTDGFYDPLLSFFEKMVEEHFLRPEHRRMWTVTDRPENLMEAIRSSDGWDSSAIGFALV